MKLRRKKEKVEKRVISVEENETVEKEKKITSHPVMQMQSFFGNRAIALAIKNNERFLRNRKGRSRRLADTLQSVQFIPIYRFPNSPQVGVRMYLTKEQYHYDHRLYLPKKRKDQDRPEENVPDQRKEKVAPLKKRTQIGSNSGLFHLDQNNEIEETNSKAREHFLRQTQKSDKNMSLQEMIQKKIKQGRFSFLSAYPLLVKMIRQINKEKQKERKKSKISRLSSRFLNIM